MLQNIRDNAQGLVSKILVGLIAFTFVIFGADSLFNSNNYGDSHSPVTVNGEDIPAQDWLQAVELQRRQILINNPDIDPVTLDINAIQSSTLEQMIREKILLQYADTQGLAISDSMIDRMIVDSDSFKVDGQFDLQRFESLVANNGMTVNSYKQQLKQNSILSQAQQGISLSSFTLPALVQELALLDGQTRDIATLTLSFDEQLANTQISEEDALEYFNNNTSQYQSPEQAKVSYVVLERNRFIDKVSLTDASVLAAYEENKARFESAAAQEQNVAHILLNIDDQQTQEQALSKAQEAYTQLQAGTSFADVAAAFSQDTVSAEDGGDLGAVSIGEFGGEFDDALSALKVGEYSKPFVTQFGVQIIKRSSSDAIIYPSFSEQEAEIRDNLKNQEADVLFAAASNTLEDLAFSTPDLSELSDELNLPIQSTQWFQRIGPEAFGEQAQSIANAAFSDDVRQGNNSNIIPLSTNALAVISLDDYQPQRDQAFSEVADLVRQQLARNQALSDLQAQAEALQERLQQGASAQAIAVDMGSRWQVFEGIGRGASEVSALISQAAFRLPKPSADKATYGSSTDYSGDIALIQLQKVIPPDLSTFDEAETRNLSLVISGMLGQADSAAFNANLNNQAEIERM